jgi:hypothetical protein
MVELVRHALGQPVPLWLGGVLAVLTVGLLGSLWACWRLFGFVAVLLWEDIRACSGGGLFILLDLMAIYAVVLLVWIALTAVPLVELGGLIGSVVAGWARPTLFDTMIWALALVLLALLLPKARFFDEIRACYVQPGGWRY